MTATSVRELDLNDLILKSGAHSNPEQGFCVMEAVAFVAGEPFSDHPQCASPVLGAFLRRLNDNWSDESRQLLKPLIPQLVGTNTGSGDEETRRWMIADWLIHEYLPAFFQAAGLSDFAERLERLAAVTGREAWDDARQTVYAIRDDAYELRKQKIEELREKLLADAVAVADAVAGAGAGAVAVAVADADAVAGAGAGAGAVAVAVAGAGAGAGAVAGADAGADADAVADAVAGAVAVADADAVADAGAGAGAGAVAGAVADADADAVYREALAAAGAEKEKGGDYWDQRHAAYLVLLPFYKKVWEERFVGLGLRESVLQLIARLIEVGKA